MVELSTPMAPGRRCAGTICLTRPMARASRGAAAPWSTRPAMSGGSVPATALSTDPTTSRPRATSETARLPYMSPSRDSSGMDTAPDSSPAVSAHEAVVEESPHCRSRPGSSGTTTVIWREPTATANARTATTQEFLYMYRK